VLLRDVPLGMTLGKDEDRVGYVKLQGFSTSAAAELAYVIGQLQVLCVMSCAVSCLVCCVVSCYVLFVMSLSSSGYCVRCNFSCVVWLCSV